MTDIDFSTPGRWCRKCWVSAASRSSTCLGDEIDNTPQAPKPERTHHCSQCGRCVLKMGKNIPLERGFPQHMTYVFIDHHCPWLGFRCIVSSFFSESLPVSHADRPFQGHRTYPAFIHFLCSVTLLSTYVAVISISALWYAFHNPLTIVSHV